jgi:hypothetical protein
MGVMSAVLLCAAISAPAQTPAQAAVPPGKLEVTVYGAGTQSCGTWLAQSGNEILRGHMKSWVLGFLTAYEAALLEMHVNLRHTDANAVAAWVDKYCRENPLKDVSDASANLVVELSKPE